jgi:hypothetical protein
MLINAISFIFNRRVWEPRFPHGKKIEMKICKMSKGKKVKKV